MFAVQPQAGEGRRENQTGRAQVPVIRRDGQRDQTAERRPENGGSVERASEAGDGCCDIADRVIGLHLDR